MRYQTPPPLLLSRVAEGAYWAGRYLERAEGTARLIRSHSDLIIDLPRTATLGWRPLLAVIGLEVGDGAVGIDPSEERIVGWLAADPDVPSSIVASVDAVHGNLRLTRAVMPVEAAEELNLLHDFATTTAHQAVDRRTRTTWLSAVIRHCQTLSGILADTMSHDDAYSFFTIGRQLERADMTSRVLDVQANMLTHNGGEALEPYLDISWFAALRSVSALQAFRRSGLPSSPEAKVTFLLRNAKCPRTVESCLVETARWLLEVPGHAEAMARCAEAQAMLEQAEPARLVRSGLHDFTDDLQRAVGRVHQAIDSTWFQPVPAQVA